MCGIQQTGTFVKNNLQFRSRARPGSGIGHNIIFTKEVFP